MIEEHEKELGEEGVCEHCGRPGTLVINPYDEDVNNTIVYEFMCDDCYKVACDDI